MFLFYADKLFQLNEKFNQTVLNGGKWYFIQNTGYTGLKYTGLKLSFKNDPHLLLISSLSLVFLQPIFNFLIETKMKQWNQVDLISKKSTKRHQGKLKRLKALWLHNRNTSLKEEIIYERFYYKVIVRLLIKLVLQSYWVF